MPLLQSLPKAHSLAPGFDLLVHPDSRFKRGMVQFSFDCSLDGQSPARTLLSQVLPQGTQQYPSRRMLSRRTEELYGSGFHFGGSRAGDTHRMELQLDWLADRFLPEGQSISENVLQLGYDLLSDPYHDEGEPFSETVVAREQDQLLRQIRSMKDDRTAFADERFLFHLCQGEPMGNSPWGTEEAVKALTLSCLESARQHLLQKAPLTVVAVGPVDEAALIAFLSKHFVSPALRDTEPVQVQKTPGALREVHEVHDVDQAKFHFGFRIPTPTSPEEMEALGLANLVLGGGIQGRLFREIREKKSLAYGIGSQLQTRKGLLTVSAGIDGSSYSEVRDEVLTQIRDIQEGGVQEEELEMAYAAIENALQGLADSPGGLANYIAREHLLGFHRSPQERIDRLRDYGSEQLAEAACSWKPDLVYLLSAEGEKS